MPVPALGGDLGRDLAHIGRERVPARAVKSEVLTALVFWSIAVDVHTQYGFLSVGAGGGWFLDQIGESSDLP